MPHMNNKHRNNNYVYIARFWHPLPANCIIIRSMQNISAFCVFFWFVSHGPYATINSPEAKVHVWCKMQFALLNSVSLEVVNK